MASTSIADKLRALKEPIISAEDLRQGAIQFKHCFLGKVYSDKAFSVSDLDKELKILWPKSKDIYIKKEEDESFLVKFQTQDEYDVVLKLRPWFLDGDLFVLVPWNPEIPKSLVDLTKQLFWLRLYNMQPGFATVNIVYSLSTVMGEVKELDPPDCVLPKGKIQRVSVVIDVRNPLPRGFWVTNAAGEEVWIRLYYEKQPFNLCNFCYTIDHNEADCSTIAADLLQQQRGHFSSTSIYDPPSWTNPDVRKTKAAKQRALEANQKAKGINNEDQSTNLDQHIVVTESDCMHGIQQNPVHFIMEVSKDSVNLKEQHKDKMVRDIPLSSIPSETEDGGNAQGMLQTHALENLHDSVVQRHEKKIRIEEGGPSNFNVMQHNNANNL
ncbi:uncharacterized protein LOC113312720 [Papaver somniferum]|uniref:uncharacterized protein LOC113312720 n=1 Tax=Papaver somniferum TaxID=3469 RepID=UPI000E7037B8|nr:uncharacterized protein LOC113312720 [Papaver somniferum]